MSHHRIGIESSQSIISYKTAKGKGKRGGKKENDPSLLGDLPTKHSSAWPPLFQMHVSKSTCMKLASSSQTATCEPSLLFFPVPRYTKETAASYPRCRIYSSWMYQRLPLTLIFAPPLLHWKDFSPSVAVGFLCIFFCFFFMYPKRIDESCFAEESLLSSVSCCVT